MIFEIRPFGPLATNSFLLAPSSGGKAYIFDAPQGSFQYWKGRAHTLSLSIAGIFFTHSHWDHIADAAAMKEYFQAPLWIHAEDAGNLREPGSDGLPLYFPIVGVEPDHFFEEGQWLSLDAFSLLVLHTPGHTPGGVCFYFAEKEILIAGDTIFQGSIGRLDLPTARPNLMKASLEKIKQLPGNTTIFPGHGDPTTVEDEIDMINFICEEEL